MVEPDDAPRERLEVGQGGKRLGDPRAQLPGWYQSVHDFDDISVSAEDESEPSERGKDKSDNLVAGQPGDEQTE